MNVTRKMSPQGKLGTKLIKAPGPGLRWKIKNYANLRFIKVWLAVYVFGRIANAFGVMTAHGKLEARLIKADGSVINYGLLGLRQVTTAWVNDLVDNLIAETTAFGDYKFHDSGEGGTAENASDTDIETTDGESRATGTQVEVATYEYRSVGTISYSTTKAIVEHGLFNIVTGGTLMDRTVFSTINVGNGDSIQFTYTITFTAGS